MYGTTSRTRNIAIILTVVSLLAVAPLTSCSTAQKTPSTDTNKFQTAQPSNEELTLPAADAEKLNEAIGFGKDNGYAAKYGARPSYEITENGKPKLMTILDREHREWKPGTHKIEVFCLGTGTLDVSLKVGDSQAENPNAKCSKNIEMTTLTIDTPGADEGWIQITPAKGTKAYIGYRLAETTGSAGGT